MSSKGVRRLKTNGVLESSVDVPVGDFKELMSDHLQRIEDNARKDEELKQLEQTAFKEQFDRWKAADLSIVDKVDLPNEGMVIINVMYYVNKPKTSSIILEGVSDNLFYQSTNLAKIMHPGASGKFKPNDVVLISAHMSKNIINDLWVKYQSTIREQPSMRKELTEPPIYVGKLTEWSQYIFQLEFSKETSLDDQHTFCLPERYIQAILK